MLALRNSLLAVIAAPLLIGLVACGSSGSGDSSSQTAGTGAAGATGNSGAGGNLFTSSGSMGTSSTNSGPGDCDPSLTGIVRDFRAYDNGVGHPDFETFVGDGLKGIVETTLGADHKPVHASAGGTAHTTGPAEFDQWYRDTANVNIPIQRTLVPVVENGVATYDNSAFFPIDNEGFGNEGRPHNFHFTFELHMIFSYKGGEVFTFTGDDDLWVFVNDRLAIDLGGLHPAQSDTLDLDARAAELGITIGQDYPLDFFHAERHTDESNFRIQSTLDFSNCDTIVY